MTGKRPYDGSGQDGDAKRIHSNNGSPVPAQSNGGDGMTEAERKRAAAQARINALKAKMTKPGQAPAAASPSPAPPVQTQARPSPAAATPPPTKTNGAGGAAADSRALAQRKIEEVKAKIAAQRKGASASPVTGGQGRTPPPRNEQNEGTTGVSDAVMDARRRVAELAKQRKQAAQAAPGPPPRTDTPSTARGGLGIGIHPSLMGDSSAPSKTKTQQGPKFSTTKGNHQPAPAVVNPYLATGDDNEAHFDDEIYDPSVTSRKGGERKTRELVFNQKGKFIAQANALKQQAKMEEMKRQIALEARKTEIEEAGDKAFLVPEPPEVEWWDEGLLAANQPSYDNWEAPNHNRIIADDSIITAYIQHPVMIEPPQDKNTPGAKPMMLTKKEQAKVRRQRRMADMKEQQAKIRLGLVPPPPPKVKKSNMMRVLGEQAVKDPTAVEARVNREIAQRKTDHEKANEERKLTKEQKAEKLRSQQEADEKKGVQMCVFRVENLSSGKHRFQIDINAKQHALMGVVVLHPTMNLVIVEGGAHSIKDFKKLMLNRIKWAENTVPLSNNAPTTFTGPSQHSAAGEQSRSEIAKDTWLNPLREDGGLKDLGGNRCRLVWEGVERAKVFKRWYSRVCETDGEAKEVLRRTGMENMWTLARSLGEGE